MDPIRPIVVASENNKRLAKNTIFLYLRMIVTMGVGFYTSRVVFNALGVVDYGLYFVVGGVVGTLAFLNGSMAGATQRFLTIALGREDTEELITIFKVGLSAQAIIALGVFALSETIGLYYLYNHAVIPGDRLEASFWVFQISVATMVVSIINVPFQGAIIAHERIGMYALLSITDVAIKLVICFVIAYIQTDKLIFYAALLFIAFVINFLWMQAYCFKHFIEARFRFGWNRELLKKMIGLAGWSLSGNLAFLANTQGITLLINLFFGPAINGAAAIAAQAGNLINQFCVNFQIAINPQITKSFAQENHTKMQELVFRSSKFSFFLMLFLAIPLFYEASYLLNIWLGKVPEHTVHFLRVGLFLSMIQAVRNPLITSAMASGDLRKYQSVVISILFMALPATFLVYHFGGIAESSTYVLLITTVVATFASAYMLTDMVHLQFGAFVKIVILKITIVAAITFSAPLAVYLILDEGFLRLLAITVFSTATTAVTVYLIGLAGNEREFALKMISSVMKRLSPRKFTLIGQGN